MPGRRRLRALTAPLRPVAERGTLILAPRLQSTTSSQWKRPIVSPATRWVRLEGLVDVFVTDENLHASFLFNSAVDERGGTRDTHEDQFSEHAANWGARRFRYVAAFWQITEWAASLPVF